MKAYELLNSPLKWTRFSFARDEYGQSTESYQANAVSWCLLGAINRCYYDDPKRDEIYSKIEKKFKSMQTTPSDWNDAPERTWKEVHALLKELDI